MAARKFRNFFNPPLLKDVLLRKSPPIPPNTQNKLLTKPLIDISLTKIPFPSFYITEKWHIPGQRGCTQIIFYDDILINKQLTQKQC